MKRAIVFGATGGIGRAICSELAAAGWALYVHYNHHSAAADSICQTLSQDFPQQDFLPLKLDFTATDEELSELVGQLLPVNALVFSQGVTNYDFLQQQSMNTIERIIQVDLVTPIKLTHLFEPLLIKQDFSRIVYLGSVYGAVGSPMEAVYSAAKAGLTRFSQAYAREVASTGLSVNVLAPGAVDTPMNAMFSQETMQEVKSEIPFGRLASGQDVSFWVKNLLDPRAGYLTGQTIYVSGGWLV